LGLYPDKPVLEVSYSADLAHRFGKLNRRKVEEFGRQIFGIEISKEKSSMTEWDIHNQFGGMVSVGIDGSITGKGGSLVIIDDPIKNRKEAESEVIRNKIWNEWQNTIYTRLQDDAIVILIVTRWHEDDLAGRLLNPEFSDPREIAEWEILSLPAICEDGSDPLGRIPGQSLWPEYGFHEDWAEKTKRTVGSQTWAALYQQRPAPTEGSLIKRNWWKFYSKLPEKFDEIIQSWDCAFKDTDTSDFVVGQVWGRIGADKYLIDQVRGRMDFPATIQAIKTLSAKHPRATAKLIEDKANGTAVIATLKHQVSGLISVNPEGGKVVRAQAVTPEIEAGNVYLPAPSIASWIHDFIEECASFPRGKHDDQVDAMSQSLARLQQQQRPQFFIA
jgi:predicted phage terminase large subunit-like protein